MNNTVLPPASHHGNPSKPKPRSIWETTRRWIQPKSRVKDVQLSPVQDAKPAGYGGYESIQTVDTQQLRLFVGTWNVAGKIPTDEWVIQEWLGSQEAADIYVLGFQEIVPLNAGNVLGNEDNGISPQKWDELIMKALNESCCSSAYLSSYSSSDSELTDTRRTSSTTAPSSPSSFDGSWFQACYEEVMQSNMLEGVLPRRLTCDLYTDIDGNGRRHSSAEESYNLAWHVNTPLDPTTNSPLFASNIMPSIKSPDYVKIASKQLVGLFVSIWIRQSLHRHVKAVDFSTVGCGIMGRLGNKVSVSTQVKSQHKK